PAQAPNGEQVLRSFRYPLTIRRPFAILPSDSDALPSIETPRVHHAAGGTVVAWPLATCAQQPRRLAVLILHYSQTDREGQASIAAFLDTFQKLGWSDGRNIRIEYRWGAGDAERAKAAAAELDRSAPDVFVVATAPALAELHRLTSTIPEVAAAV